MANHRFLMLDLTHGAPGTPHPIPRLARLAPHPIGHLEDHLAGRRRVTWWRVSAISPISLISPQAPKPPFYVIPIYGLPLYRIALYGMHGVPIYGIPIYGIRIYGILLYGIHGMWNSHTWKYADPID